MRTIEMHILQNFGPQCLNRDSDNMPKTCSFAGYKRARISSQCWKRAVRFSDYFQNGTIPENGHRSWRQVEEFNKTIKKLDSSIDEEMSLKLAISIVNHFNKKDGLLPVKFKPENEEYLTSVCLFLSSKEVEEICQSIIDNQDIWDKMKKELATVDLKTLAPPIKNKDKTDGEDKDENNLDNAEEETNKKDSKKIKISYSKDLKNIIRAYKNTFLSPDIALFGRMIAEANYLDVDASCQMAHVISTNKIEQESDYFTASDDLKPDDVSGSNMMEDIGYNSSCFYRYSNINIDKLMENLNNDVDLVKNTIISFVKGNIYAIPSAKQNSMAAQNLPSFVFIVIRDSGAPMSLANAFATPIKPEYNGNLIELSVKSLCEYWNSMKNMYGEDGVSFTGVSYNCDSKYVVDFSDNIPINNLIEEIKNNL